MIELRAYMAYQGDPEEAAVLVWHYSASEAKAMAIAQVPWLADEPEYTEIERLSDPGMLPRRMDVPHVIERPPVCDVCEQWGPTVHPSDSLCEQCRSNMEDDT